MGGGNLVPTTPIDILVTIGAPLAAPTTAPVSQTIAYDSTATPIPLNLGGGTAASVAVATAAAHGTATASGTTISYTPTVGFFGTDSFTYTATNATGTSSPATASITVSPPVISVTPTTLTAGTVGTAYSHSLSPSSGQAPYSFATTVASGALPAGLSLGTNGTISGTPTASGVFTFTVSGTDSSTLTHASFTSATISLTIAVAAPTVAPVSQTVAYDSTATAITLSLGGGAAASVAVATAATHGTATASGTTITYTPATGFFGTDSFTYTATNATGTSSPATASITVSPPVISVTPATLTAGTVGTAYSQSLSPSGGQTPYTFATTVASGALPAGLSLGTGGTISGTPTASGVFTFTVSGTDSSTTTHASFTSATISLTIAVAPVSQTVAYDSSATPIPLSLGGGAAASVAVASAATHGTATASGTAISYTPTVGFFGTDSFTYTATNATGTSSPATASITVSPPVISVTPTTLAGGTVGTAYNHSLSPSGGQAPYTFATTVASGALPAGLSLGSNGTISGTPTASGSFTFTVSGTDSSTLTHASFTSATISLTIAVAAPTVTAISPTSGPVAGGTSVTITGTNLTGATAVKFGTTSATITANSATSITATSPIGTGTVDVTVITAGGTSATSPADQFTYIAGPTVTVISPTSGPAAGGTSVVITGTNFTGASAVKFGTTSATITANSATSITATSPAGTGTVDITVTTAGGTSATSPADQFTYIAAPTVSSISPASGPTAGGTSVTITGANFTGATGVTIGGAAATGITVNSATSITATTPAATAGPASVLVTTPSGTNPANTLFTYATPAPTVTSINPTSGPTTGGTSVTITGTNFTGATSVKFGMTNATSFTVISAIQISTIAPPGSLGTVDVTVRTPGGTSSVSAADQYSYAVPVDSINLRKLQATVTPMAAQIWGQATVGAMESAVSEGFAGGGRLVSPSGNGMRFNFSADPDDQQQQATDGTARARGRSGSADPFSSANGSFDTNARGLAGPGRSRANDGNASRTDDAFSALGYAGPVKAQPLRVTEPRDWLAWAEISGATLNRWTAPTAVNAVPTIASIYGDQINFTAGLTRVLTPNFLVGVLGGWETFDYRSDAIQGRLTGTGWTAGTYAGWKLSSTIRLNAGVAYSGIGFDGTAGTASGSFAGNRLLVTGGVTGNYKSYGFLIEPSATVYALWEHENAYTDTLGTAQAGRDFSTGRASTGVKLAYPFAWTSTVMLSPYAGIYGDYYFNTDNIVIPGAGALPVTPVFAGISARTSVGMAAHFANGGELTIGGERSGLGGSFSLWTYRARASIPFGAQ
jgi:hypothetical protein